ncbi:peptidase domain-containing ABC transporter [Parabacteroides sp. OttesenSCG-928-J18]|nr:peptidase domain-containing ABC transporter [Bacteroides sp. OttesenSCG-928-N06]MDL2245789.1 peptidase domain-containing ABC transporter [Parabacteroides sp. OttesenSCG-928-J18]MDL2305297.1 peptidase domain-containing ABC transporter [Bacteroides sp. OttesenSCG-928-D19]
MKLKFCKQLDAMDCGPSCLKMVASYYGKDYSLNTLRVKSLMGKDGVSLKGISKAAEHLGFKTVGGRFTIKQLVEKKPFPCIIHWNQNHFIVVYDIKKHRKQYIIHVADPGKGLLKYNLEEFQNHWISTQSGGEEKGIALLLEPTTMFYEKEEKKEIRSNKHRFLFQYFLRYKKFFGQLILGLTIGSLLQLIFPFLTQAIVDTGIINQDISFIWLILLAQLMLLLGRTSIDFIRRKILLHISTRINISLISDFLIKLMKLPMSFFDTKLLGDLLQRIEDHSRIERFLTAQTLNLLFSLFSFIVFGIVLLIYNLKIFTVFFIGSIIYGIWILFFLKHRRILDYKYFEQQAINRSKVYQLINGMQEIKLQGCEQRKRWEWEDVQADLFDVNLQSLSLQQTQEAGSITINEIKNILITVLAATAVIHGELTLGMMLSIQYIIGQLNSPVEQIMNFIYQWQDVNISLERMSEIHERKNEEDEDMQIISLPKQSDKTIHLKNVMFQYEGSNSRKVLNHINLDIPEGKVTAIVGASGSGKTTLVKLLLGHYSPIEGEIYIGEYPLKKFNLSWWRSQCGAVMQDGYIFSESIARNIAVSTEEIDTKKLKQAATVANIDDFVIRLPLSYNTVIGQEGQGISQGQRQRLLIARAVYKDPNFLFFDEATNSLDANNEKTIIENLATFYKGKTVVIVAHRLSTVKSADNIIVLDNGEIAEQGDHDSLTRKKGKYYQLVKNQLELGN